MVDGIRARIEATHRSLVAAEAAVGVAAWGAITGITIAAHLPPLLLVPAMVPTTLMLGGAAYLLGRQDLLVRRGILREAASAALDVERAGEGELVRARGRVRVLEPVVDPGSGDRIGAYVRWARRTDGCGCWHRCDHEGGRRLAIEGRCGVLEIVGEGVTAHVAPTWIDTAAPIRWRDAGRHGALIVRDGDEVAIAGQLARTERGEGGYRGGRRSISIGPGIDGCVLLDPITR